MSTFDKIIKLNDYSRDQIKTKIHHLIIRKLEEMNSLQFVNNTSEKSLSQVIKAAFLVSFVVSQHQSEGYEDLIESLNKFLESKDVSFIEKKNLQALPELENIISLTINFIKQTNQFIDLRQILIDMTLLIIAYDNIINDLIIKNVINLLDLYNYEANNLEKKTLDENHHIYSNSSFLNSNREEIFVIRTTLDDAKRIYFDNYMRSLSVLLFIHSDNFSNKLKNSLNDILNYFNLMQIEDEIEYHFKTRGLENNRYLSIVRSVKLYLNLCNKNDLETNEKIYKMFLGVLKSIETQDDSLIKILKKLTIEGGDIDEYI